MSCDFNYLIRIFCLDACRRTALFRQLCQAMNTRFVINLTRNRIVNRVNRKHSWLGDGIMKKRRDRNAHLFRRCGGDVLQCVKQQIGLAAAAHRYGKVGVAVGVLTRLIADYRAHKHLFKRDRIAVRIQTRTLKALSQIVV